MNFDSKSSGGTHPPWRELFTSIEHHEAVLLIRLLLLPVTPPTSCLVRSFLFCSLTIAPFDYYVSSSVVYNPLHPGG